MTENIIKKLIFTDAKLYQNAQKHLKDSHIGQGNALVSLQENNEKLLILENEMRFTKNEKERCELEIKIKSIKEKIRCNKKSNEFHIQGIQIFTKEVFEISKRSRISIFIYENRNVFFPSIIGSISMLFLGLAWLFEFFIL